MDIGVSETAALLREKDNILILSHTHPDGDTLGSATALCRALQALGKHARVTCEDAIPDKFGYLYRGLDAIDFKPDFYVAVDVADKKLLGRSLPSGMASGSCCASTTTPPIRSTLSIRCLIRRPRPPVS